MCVCAHEKKRMRVPQANGRRAVGLQTVVDRAHTRPNTKVHHVLGMWVWGGKQSKTKKMFDLGMGHMYVWISCMMASEPTIPSSHNARMHQREPRSKPIAADGQPYSSHILPQFRAERAAL